MPAFIGPRPLDLALGSVDDSGLYCSGPDGLEARSLTDGQLLWKRRDLTDAGPRQLQRVGSVLLSQPGVGENHGWEFRWLGLALRFPSLSQLAPATLYCTVDVIDPKTGFPLQALNVTRPLSPQPNYAISLAALSARPNVKLLSTAAPRVLVTPERLLVVQGQATTAFDITTVASTASSSANLPH
jgi:hypothetical protein